MEKKKLTKVEIECLDKLCPLHGKKKIRVRGRVFEGDVIKKLNGRVVIMFERMIRIPKYERYEKRKTRIHSRLPSCMDSQIEVGDRIEVSETRPISKIISSVVTKLIKKESGGKVLK